MSYHFLLPKEISTRRCIVDTSTLFIFLAISFVKMRESKHFLLTNHNNQYKFGSQIPTDEKRQNQYFELFSDISEIVTTSHVIGELNRHLNNIKESNDFREEFLQHSLAELRQKNFTETLLSLLELDNKILGHKMLDPNLLTRIGIVDVGLLQLAKDTKLPILTEDRKTLGMEAGNYGVKCLVLPNYFV